MNLRIAAMDKVPTLNAFPVIIAFLLPLSGVSQVGPATVSPEAFVGLFEKNCPDGKDTDLTSVWRRFGVDGGDFNQWNCGVAIVPLDLNGGIAGVEMYTYNGPYRLVLFKAKDGGWSFFGLVDLGYQKYHEPGIQVVRAGSRQWLVFDGMGTSGTGVSSRQMTWFEVREADIQRVLDFPGEGSEGSEWMTLRHLPTNGTQLGQNKFFTEGGTTSQGGVGRRVTSKLLGTPTSGGIPTVRVAFSVTFVSGSTTFINDGDEIPLFSREHTVSLANQADDSSWRPTREFLRRTFRLCTT